jgi:hypothetical protein
LNSGLHACKAGTLPLEPHLQSILLWLFWRWGGVSQTICPCWPWTSIPLFSASQVARITGRSNRPLAPFVGPVELRTMTNTSSKGSTRDLSQAQKPIHWFSHGYVTNQKEPHNSRGECYDKDIPLNVNEEAWGTETYWQTSWNHERN